MSENLDVMVEKLRCMHPTEAQVWGTHSYHDGHPSLVLPFLHRAAYLPGSVITGYNSQLWPGGREQLPGLCPPQLQLLFPPTVDLGLP